jgi:cell division protein FtsB
MSSLKKTLMTRGMKLMSDPRVLKLMQDERVMKAVMQMMAVPGKVQTFTHEQVERLAKSMALATEDEMKDLKRTVRRLEEEVARMKQAERRERERASASSSSDDRPSTRGVSGSAAAPKKATSAE